MVWVSFFIASHVISFAYIPIQESCLKSCHHLQLNTLLKVVKVSATLNFQSLFAIPLQSGFFFDLALTESHWFHQNILCRIKITLCLYKAKKYNILLHKSLELHDRNYSHLKRLQKKINKVWVQENGVQCAMVWRNVALAPEGEVVEKLFQLFECRMFIPVFGMNVKDEQLVNICWLKREEKANHQ